MKYNPDSKVRSQRENMQAFQLRLPKETIRDLQILRVFAGIKVSEELRDLVVAYVNERQGVIQKTAAEFVPLEHLHAGGTSEDTEAAESLVQSGEAEHVEIRTVGRVRVDVDEKGERVLTELPMREEDTKPRRGIKRKAGNDK